MRNGSSSPTSMTSSEATSLLDQDGSGVGGGGGTTPLSAMGQSAMEDCCRDLLGIIEELSWHHSQINVP